MAKNRIPRGRGVLAARLDDDLKDRLRSAVLDPQLLLAAKAALAAALAWTIALAIPGEASRYPYYAPLGALLAIYPTVAGTLKSGLQTVIGLTIGIVLAHVAVWAGEPNWGTIAFVVGVGVLLAEPWRRTGRMAARGSRPPGCSSSSSATRTSGTRWATSSRRWWGWAWGSR